MGVRSLYDPWLMGDLFPMGHGSYDRYVGPIPMHHGSYDGEYTPCQMGRTVVHMPHGPWVVRHLSNYHAPMDHGPYDSTATPWAMGRTTGHSPMDHGSYDRTSS